MSFSSDIKNKLCEINDDCKYCKRAQLAAMIKYTGKVKDNKIILTTENKSVAGCINRMITDNTGVMVNYIYKSKSKLYEITIEDPLAFENICDAIMLFDDDYEILIPFDCCKSAYLRGAFLGGGSISDPQKSYHMEFDSRHEPEADRLCRLLKKLNISARITCRKGHSIVYIKEYSTIADILGAVGASGAALDIYNISVEKDVRNNINRQMNCENANMDKVADAYKKHLSAIERIRKSIGIEGLPDTLREIALIRLDYPEDSLKQLGERLQNPIGKSGVNHRLNRIVEIADGLTSKQMKGQNK